MSFFLKIIVADENLVLKLYYDRQAYQLSYDAKGGAPMPGNETLRWDQQSHITAVPTRAGYNFVRWQLVPGSNAAYDATTKVLTMGNSDAKLEAVWQSTGSTGPDDKPSKAISTETQGPDGTPIETPIDLAEHLATTPIGLLSFD